MVESAARIFGWTPTVQDRIGPLVQASLLTLGYDDYAEIGTNMLLGFFERTLRIGSSTVANCTIYAMNHISIYQ